MTQSTLARPDTSRRRNRSPNTVISNQNHSTKIKIEKTSVRKLGKVKPPANNMSVLPFDGMRRPPSDGHFADAVRRNCGTKYRSGQDRNYSARSVFAGTSWIECI